MYFVRNFIYCYFDVIYEVNNIEIVLYFIKHYNSPLKRIVNHCHKMKNLNYEKFEIHYNNKVTISRRTHFCEPSRGNQKYVTMENYEKPLNITHGF